MVKSWSKLTFGQKLIMLVQLVKLTHDSLYELTYYEDGISVHLGEKYANKRSGLSIWIHKGIVRKITTFKHDIIHGECVGYSRGGKIVCTVPYKYGRLDGISKVYNSHRLIKEITYCGNFKHGPSIIYYKNGQSIKVEYVYGILKELYDNF